MKKFIQKIMSENDLSLQNFNSWVESREEQVEEVNGMMPPLSPGPILEEFLMDLHGKKRGRNILKTLGEGCKIMKKTRFFYIIEHDGEEIKIPILMIGR